MYKVGKKTELEKKKKDGIKVDKKDEPKSLLKVQRYLRSHSLKRVIGNLQHQKTLTCFPLNCRMFLRTS